MPVDVASVLSPMRPIPAGVPRFGAAIGPVFRGDGAGSFAGAFPDGVTSVEGVPASAEVIIRARAPGTALDGVEVARAVSSSAGEWLVPSMPETGEFDVVARKEGECDVVKSSVAPLAPLRTVFPPAFCVPIGSTRTALLSARGGEGPYTYAAVSGTFPSGVALVGDSLVATAPVTTPGEYPVTVEVTDARGATASAEVRIDLVALALNLSVSITAEAVWRLPSTAFLESANCEGGFPPYTYGVASGTLPTGVTLDASTGALTGTLGSATEKSTFSIGVTDSFGGTAVTPSLTVYTYAYEAHRYWRLNITAHNGNGDVSLAELRFTDPATGTALPVPVANAFASSSYHSGFVAGYAFDNVLGTRWAASASTDPLPVFLGASFAEPVSIGAVVLIAPASGMPANCPQDFSVQYSDDNVTWADEWFVTGQTSWTSNQTKTFLRKLSVSHAGGEHTQWGAATVG